MGQLPQSLEGLESDSSALYAAGALSACLENSAIRSSGLWSGTPHPDHASKPTACRITAWSLFYFYFFEIKLVLRNQNSLFVFMYLAQGWRDGPRNRAEEEK